MKFPLPLLCAVLLAGLVSSCGGEPPAKLNTGDAAPAFKTDRPDGTAVDFPAAYAGKPVVLRFWADWCKFCEPEMKLIDAVRERHGGRFAILAVNAGQDKATVDAFMKKLGVGYPSALDESSKIARTYGVVGLPTTFLIDGRGIVRGKIVGETDAAMFERHVQNLLK
ncbi:MAG: TlpA disulfide reductase family protein [Rhodocyclaceae bacterium]|jgi:peroxiredoxin|nr:TlpA disulfide reductase family protein [Rhodocyclaceae bacterium]